MGGTTVSSQSMLEQYFGGDKESLVKEATKLIHTSETTFKPTNKPTEPVLFFNLPETVPLRKYSYRANMSMTPDDYVAGLKAVNGIIRNHLSIFLNGFQNYNLNAHGRTTAFFSGSHRTA